MHGAFVVLLFVLHASANQWNNPSMPVMGVLEALTYQRSGTQCLLCQAENQCLAFNQNRCEYYLETNKILDRSFDEKHEQVIDNPKLKAEVDSMVFSIMERAQAEDLIQECVPYVSKYTDCTKDNVCLGCKTCDCDIHGRWNCTTTQTCRPEIIVPAADQRTLFSVIETLKLESTTTRRKRSIGHSIRSLEEMHLGEHSKDEEDQEMVTKWESEGANHEDSDEDTVTYHINENDIGIDPHESMRSKDKEKDENLMKWIVHSVLYDTLPEILKQNNIALENNRVKRSINITNVFEKDPAILKHKVTFEELSDWVNHVHPLIYTVRKINFNISSEENVSTDNRNVPVPKNLPLTPSTKGKMIDEAFPNSNPDYLAFEEVYSNIKIDNRTNIRRKPPLDHSVKFDTDFNMYDDKYYKEEDNTSATTGEHVKDIINIFAATIGDTSMEAVTESDRESATKVVVDLLETANMINSVNETENLELSNNKIDNFNTEKLEPMSAVNIMKRDVSSIIIHNKTNSSISTNTVSLPARNLVNATQNNAPSPITLDDLKESVFYPLENILEYKQKEINQMVQIRENLVKFLQAHTNESYSSTKNYSSLYNFEYTSHHHHKHDLRSNNASILDRYMIKLKHDVYEVIRDIVGIKKFYNASTKFPSELIFLIKSLKHYIHKTGIQPNKMPANFRRSNTHNKISGFSVKNVIINIFELLNKNVHHMDALAPLSSHSKKILKRLIKKNYVDDFAGTGLRVYDPHYNLTNDLNIIGSRWQTLTKKIAASSVADKLDNMKRLHLVLSVDIAKMNDALALIDFARGRRMMPVDEAEGEKIVKNINKNLNIVKDKINEIVIGKSIVQQEDDKPDENIIPIHKKKNSFLSQIKNLLRSSKTDILKLLRRKVPKDDIVKQIARKNVEEMTKKKLRDTMEKWQTNLNIISTRDKRAINFERRRIKNIIPIYLRGKVPGMSKSNKKGKGKSKKAKPVPFGRQKKGSKDNTIKHSTTTVHGHTTIHTTKVPESKTTASHINKPTSTVTSTTTSPPIQLNITTTEKV